MNKLYNKFNQRYYILFRKSVPTTKEMRELVQYIRKPYVKELAKLKLSYDNLKRHIEIIEQVQSCYNWNETAFNFALKVLDKWRDNIEISK